MPHWSIAIPLTNSALAILKANPHALRYRLQAIVNAYARGLAPSLTALRSNISRMAGVFARS